MRKLMILAFLLFGCTAQQWKSVGTGLAKAASNTTATSDTRLLIFGGENHDVFLGCLSCSQYDTDSVFNTYGSFGSQYSSSSIYNSFGEYGSPYSVLSACNKYATSPPVVVDGDGQYFGELTLNVYASDAITEEKTLSWLKDVCAAK